MSHFSSQRQWGGDHGASCRPPWRHQHHWLVTKTKNATAHRLPDVLSLASLWKKEHWGTPQVLTGWEETGPVLLGTKPFRLLHSGKGKGPSCCLFPWGERQTDGTHQTPMPALSVLRRSSSTWRVVRCYKRIPISSWRSEIPEGSRTALGSESPCAAFHVLRQHLAQQGRRW